MSHTSPKILSAKRSLEIDLSGLKLIEASAGTGKTYTISNLFCRFIVEGKALQNILLVTFTNAATDELKQRIRARLKDVLTLFKHEQKTDIDDEFLALLLEQFCAHDNTEQEMIINRLVLAIRSFDEAAIHTINGFCQRMLGDYAFNSAQHYELNLLQNDKELWQMALKDWWRTQSYGLNKSHYALFIKSVKNLKALSKNTESLRSDNVQILIPETHTLLPELYQQWDDLNHKILLFKETWQQHKEMVFDLFNDHKIFKKSKLFHNDKIQSNLESLNAFLSMPTDSFLAEEFKLLCLPEITKNTLKSNLDQLSNFDHPLFLQADELWKSKEIISAQFKASALIDAECFANEQTSQAKLKQQSLTFDDQLKYLNTALSSSNGVLAHTIREQFSVALIDEFQDTNDIQYSIFKQVYQNQKDVCLIMIGDPKQAIYSFRGGDIFTYIQAKHQVGDELYSLNSNWRSTPQLIDAVNHFFSQRDDSFIYSDAMPFEPVTSGSDKTPVLTRLNKPQPALSVWHLTKDYSKKSAAININHHVANEISALINEGQSGTALLGKDPVKPADIAILVRSNYEGQELATALKQRGIHSINTGKDKVLQSDAAKGLLLLMTGVAQASDIQACRNMLASRLFMYTPEQINQFIQHQSTWLSWLENVKSLHNIWLQDGFIAMFHTMLRSLNIAQALLQQDNSERHMTNLLHSAEIIQQAAKTYATPHALCAWLKQHVNSPENSSDEDELRLESDAQLVKIVTVHKSKGLEYPIVFVPFLWKSKPISDKKTFYQYHNDEQQKVFDFLLPDAELNTHKTLAFIHADKERLAEDMRLLYVALTRARSQCYLVTADNIPYSASKHSALAFLCHRAQSAADLHSQQADMGKYAKKNNLATELDLMAQANANITFKVLSETPKFIKSDQQALSQTVLNAAKFSGNVNFDWHISSFSRMTRDVHQVAHGGHIKPTHDDIFNFKRGGDAGTFLHHILELIDFSGDIEAQSNALFQRFAARYHLDSEHNEHVVAIWMNEIINTALDSSGFKLAELSKKQRLDEMEFDFSLDYVDVKQLNHFLAKRTGQTGSQLNISNFKGMMTGFIDLVYEHNGQYFVADYKSNFLGNQLSDYTADKLKQAVIDRRYDLQYLLYSLALHRYLKYRLPNYDYEQHCGGVYYLFLRAMREKTGAQFGVYYDRPSLEEMNELDHVLFKTAENS